jgi:lipoprotein-releasing system permease protein
MAPMKFEWLVARRYLRSPHRPAVLRLATMLSVAGVAAGVMTLVVALAMNSGFRSALRDRLLGVTAHINLKPLNPEGISDYQSLVARLAPTPGVRSIAPVIYGTVLLSSGTRARGVVMKGIDPPAEERGDRALQQMQAGRADFSPDRDGLGAIVIGRMLAADMNVHSGDYVTITSPEGSLTPFGLIPRSRRFRVAGVFNSGFYDYDANWVFVTLHQAQQLDATGDVASLLEVRVTNLDDAPRVAQALLQRAGRGFTVTTWMDENQALFRALSLEKLVTAIFIGLIIFISGLNILVVLTMTVTNKARDVAVLMSLGARREQVARIFLLQGLVVGFIGTVIGLSVGYAFAMAANAWRVIPLNPEVYAIPYVPFHANAWDAIWIAAASMAITAAATIYPARTAARILPVDILRYE